MYYFHAADVASGNRGIMETVQSLILGNLFGPVPERAHRSIEMGMAWVEYFLHQLDHAGGITPARSRLRHQGERTSRWDISASTSTSPLPGGGVIGPPR